jgi:GNAT superfamily N-acetyltransferase
MNETNVNIRIGQESDMPQVMDLIMELAVFEKSPESVKMTVSELEKHGFGDHPDFGLLVAESDGELLGMALYYYCFSTWRGKYLYLEDLIVRESARKLGAGSKLFTALVEKTKTEGLRQMGWQVLDWNEPAIEFYKKHGAELQSEWLNGRMYFES